MFKTKTNVSKFRICFNYSVYYRIIFIPLHSLDHGFILMDVIRTYTVSRYHLSVTIFIYNEIMTFIIYYLLGRCISSSSKRCKCPFDP